MIGQGRNDIAAFNNRLDGQAVFGLAILGNDDAVLRDVNQTPGQITGVRGFQRRVGQTLAGAVGGIEVFQHRKPFLEVGNDRGFDNFPGRLRHQAPHARQLLHLRGGAPGAGMGHHVDGIDRLAGFFRRNRLHHFIGDPVRAVGPGIDDLVVFLALGNEAVLILLLEFLDHFFGIADQLLLGLGNDQIVLAEGNAGLAGVIETDPHQVVGEDHRLFLPAVAIDLVKEVGDFLLGQQLVDKAERNVRVAGQDFAQQHAPRRGFNAHDDFFAVGIDIPVSGLDL